MRREEALQKVSLFAGLGSAHLRTLARDCTEREFETGDVIVRQGNPGIGVFIIVSGKVRIEKMNDDGTVITIAHHGPGEVIGEMSVIDGAPRTASVVAEEPTTCLVLASWAFNSFLESHPSVALHILPIVVKRFRETNDTLIRLQTKGTV